MKKQSVLTLLFISVLFAGTGSQAQQLLWERSAITPDTLNEAKFVAHDRSNNVFTVGTTWYGRMFVTKHDSLGNFLWYRIVKQYDTVAYPTLPTGLKVNSIGEVFVSGIRTDTGFVIKLNSDGSTGWVHNATAVAHAGLIYDMTLTNDGNVAIIMARPNPPSTIYKAYIQSISQATGTQNWEQQLPFVDTAIYAGLSSYVHNGYYIGSDNLNNIYLSAGSYHPWTDTFFTHFAKYSSTGTLLWQAPYSNPLMVDNRMYGFYVNYTGNIYAMTNNYGGGFGPSAIHLDNAGNYLYVQHVPYSGATVFTARHITADSIGNAYICGGATYLGMSALCVLTKLDTGGNQLWMKKIGDSTHQNIYWKSVVANNNTIYTAGMTETPAIADSAYRSLILSRYDGNGNLVWNVTRGYHHISHIETETDGIDLDNSKNILVCGETFDTSMAVAMTRALYVAKFTDTFGTTSVATNSVDHLRQPNASIYPQPATNLLNVKFEQATIGVWAFYNTNGQKIASGALEQNTRDLQIETGNWPAGVYVLRYIDSEGREGFAKVVSILR